MCTLFFRHQPDDEYPLAILSNRDEAFDRPAEGWRWRGRRASYFAPIDLEAGGTWIGLNRRGVVAALTNIFPGRDEPGFRSRGALVVDMLKLRAAVEAATVMTRQLGAHSYNNFNLLVADPRSASVFSWTGDSMQDFELRPGVYQVNNIPFDGTLRPDSGGPNASWIEREVGRLKQHPMVCRHGTEYGTRCSHKLLVHRNGAIRSKVWHLEGYPCEEQFRQVLGHPGKGA